MAENWIKMRMGLRRHPKIVRIVSALRTDRLRVVGALHAIWSVFDEHSVEGHLPGYSFEMMDEEIGWPGFSAAMAGVGWLDRDSDCGLLMPEFSAHNGESAKRRAEDAKRKRRDRALDNGVRDLSQQDPDEKRTNTGQEKEKHKRTSPSLRSGDDARPRAQGKKAIPLPEDFAISDSVRKWAAKKGYAPYLELHLEHLKDYAHGGNAQGKVPLAIDWDAKFRTCIRADWGDMRRNAMREQFKPGAKPPNGAAVPGEPWYITWTGIKNEGLRRGILQGPDEADPDYTNRVFKEAGVTRDQAAKDRAEWRGANR